MDWRASTSQLAQTDLDELLADSIQVAAVGLENQNLAPVMLTIAVGGERNMRTLGTPLRQRSADAVIEALQAPADAEALRARAIVFDVTVRTPFVGEAINVHLEHRDGQTIDILVPYRTEGDNVTIDGTAMTAATATPRLWPSGSV